MSNGTKKWRRAPGMLGYGLALALTAAGLAGCVGTVGVGAEAEVPLVYGYPTARAEVVPVQIYSYPRVYYRGSYAYLVDGRWYYPSSRGWVIFRREPQELSRYRVYYDRRYVREPVYRRTRPPPGYAYPPPPRREYRPY